MSDTDEAIPNDGVENDENTELAQLSAADSLIDRGVADPLDEGYIAPDHWSPAQGFGNTAAEMAGNETIEQRMTQEEPEPDPNAPEVHWNAANEPRQVGSKRAGRLVAAGGGIDVEDTEAESVASDVGISGGAASAEEAAMHIIEGDDDSDDNSGDSTPNHDPATNG
jgi:hypothetical protein